MSDIIKERQGKLITGIFPKGEGVILLEALAKKGVTRFNLATARGSDIQGYGMVGESRSYVEQEKEILTIVTHDKAEADDIFWFIYEQAKVEHPGGGFLYMTELSATVPYLLPDLV